MTPDWCLLLSRMQAVYSLSEIAAALGTDRMRLDRLKAGIAPKFDLGLSILVLHDEIFGKAETGRVVDRFRLRALANLESCEPRAEKSRRVAADRTRRVRAVDGRWARKVANSEVVHVAGGSEGSSEVRA